MSVRGKNYCILGLTYIGPVHNPNPLFECFVSVVDTNQRIWYLRKIRQQFTFVPQTRVRITHPIGHEIQYVFVGTKEKCYRIFLKYTKSVDSYPHPKWDKTFKEQSQNGDYSKLIPIGLILNGHTTLYIRFNLAHNTILINHKKRN